MAVRPVVKYPDPRLRQETSKVTTITEEVRALVQDLTETMFDENGAGIAAIQIGAPEKIFLIEGSVAGGEENSPPMVFINPSIEWLSDEKQLDDEGCLSFPGVFVPVKRSLRARTTAIGIDGKEFTVEGEGLYARAMQHELDHLENKLLIDYAGTVKRQMIKRKMERMTDEEADELQAAGE